MNVTARYRELEADKKRQELVRKHYLWLKEVRGLMSQAELARLAGVGSVYVSRVEQGEARGIGEKALQRILQIYLELADGRGLKIRDQASVPDGAGP